MTWNDEPIDGFDTPPDQVRRLPPLRDWGFSGKEAGPAQILLSERRKQECRRQLTDFLLASEAWSQDTAGRQVKAERLAELIVDFKSDAWLPDAVVIEQLEMTRLFIELGKHDSPLQRRLEAKINELFPQLR